MGAARNLVGHRIGNLLRIQPSARGEGEVTARYGDEPNLI